MLQEQTTPLIQEFFGQGYEEYFNGIELVHEGIPLELNPELPILLDIIGPSGAGKSTLVNLLIQRGLVTQVKTATNRERREGEPENAYTWMRTIGIGESSKDYIQNLVEEYGLIEFDEHFGRVYGLPQKNLAEVSDSGEQAIIVNENAGAETLCRELREKYNVVVITILPDSIEQIATRIKYRNDFEKRFAESISSIAKTREISHFFLHNTEQIGDDGLPGVYRGLDALVLLIQHLQQITSTNEKGNT